MPCPGQVTDPPLHSHLVSHKFFPILQILKKDFPHDVAGLDNLRIAEGVIYKKVVLHSFNHLSPSKSSPDFAQTILNEAAERLRKNGYYIMITPFGYFNELKMHVAGDSLAKVFKEF